PPERISAGWFLAADLATVGALIALTGGLDSPFAGLFYLITLAGAVYYDVAGALLVALVADAILVASSAVSAALWRQVLRGRSRPQVLAYLLLHGAVAGYLVGHLKQLHRRRVQFEERLRRAEYEEALRQREGHLAREIQRAALASPPRDEQIEAAVRFEPA